MDIQQIVVQNNVKQELIHLVELRNVHNVMMDILQLFKQAPVTPYQLSNQLLFQQVYQVLNLQSYRQDYQLTCLLQIPYLLLFLQRYHHLLLHLLLHLFYQLQNHQLLIHRFIQVQILVRFQLKLLHIFLLEHLQYHQLSPL